MPELGHELLETLDPAARAHARMDRITVRAQEVVAGFDIETPIEIERLAILVELGPDPAAVGKHEVDLVGARQLARRIAAAGMHLGPLRSSHSNIG